ncbi:hypothetical protein M406DRAFT_53764 [Cryphonectria parasitica EP155]|uniref:Uncharacterized protein n=1 Tax=Cryphonectria parasitica (strain ATCC 38755 / EP155) TaxID=660469 RepID=A0A9P5CTC0_CRYP1|nr:uncharacterized protein M406DRAFT_53764 [Cryphonectria parasitica EP155]KAF3770178.1 hypothetical protein M406DRAFT_53764 [Cryphonectria parasitica EP155]
MDLHQSQRPEPALLGKPLLMVLQPAIVACGTEEGRKYDQVSRIWLKARVWVGRGGSA